MHGNIIIDPAHPERHPDVFVHGRCGACNGCYLDKRDGRCQCGGPFASDLRRDPKAFMPTSGETLR